MKKKKKKGKKVVKKKGKKILKKKGKKSPSKPQIKEETPEKTTEDMTEKTSEDMTEKPIEETPEKASEDMTETPDPDHQKSSSEDDEPIKNKAQIFEFFNFEKETFKLHSSFLYENTGERITTFAPISLEDEKVLMLRKDNGSITGFNVLSTSLTQRFEFEEASAESAYFEKRSLFHNIRNLIPVGYIKKNCYIVVAVVKLQDMMGDCEYLMYYCYLTSDGEIHLCVNTRPCVIKFVPRGFERFQNCIIGRSDTNCEWTIKYDVKFLK